MSEQQETVTQPAPEGAPPVTPAGPSGADSVVEAPKPAKARDLAAVAKAGYELRQARKQAALQTQQLSAQLEQERQARAQEQRELAEAKKLLERVKGEALAVAAEQGGDVNKVIEDYVSKSAPEKQLAALQKELQEERAARLKYEEDRRKEREQILSQHQQQAETAAINAFLPFVQQSESKYPHMAAEFEPEEILAEVRKIHEWAKGVRWKGEDGQEHVGVQYSYDAVAQAIDKRAKLIHDRRMERRTKLLAPQQSGETLPAATSEKKNGQTTRPSRTEPKVVPRRPPSRPMSRDEEEQHDLAVLRAAMAKDAATRK